MFIPPPAVIEYIRAGRLRALAVTSAAPSEVAPFPSANEFVPDFEATNWYGVSAPRNTPIGIIELLNKTINAGLTDPKLRSQLADLGGTPMPASPADFGKLVAGKTEKWRKVIRAANIKLE